MKGNLALLLSAVYVSSCWTAVENSVLVTDEIDKSPFDKKNYRMITLSNGLKAMLISNPHAVYSAAALSVDAGSYDEPENLPGLAHYLEHMLFLGNHKYPQEGDYRGFIASHGGASNAVTSSDSTTFHFDIQSPYLEPALDRLAQFFISPLFKHDGVERELSAIDSEFRQGLHQDQRRLNAVESLLSNPHCPTSRFYAGNRKTLQLDPVAADINVRSAMIDFYQKHYSADAMYLGVYGMESLDELQKMVTEKFSSVAKVENKNHRNWSCTPFSDGPEKYAKRMIRVKSVQGTSMIKLSWILPNAKQYDEYFTMISRFLEYSGQGGLGFLLKNSGMVIDYSASLSDSIGDTMIFNVVCELTDFGRENYGDIVETVFQSIALLKTEGIADWWLEERLKMARTYFYSQPEGVAVDSVLLIIDSMKNFPSQKVLSGPFIPENGLSAETFSVVINLLNTDNFRVTLLSADPLPEGVTIQIEPHYGTEFTVEFLSESILSFIESPTKSDYLSQPAPNPFIPSDFTIFCETLSTTISPFPAAPSLVHDGQFRLWFKQDDHYLRPEAHIYLTIRNPHPTSGPHVHAAFELLSTAMAEVLTQEFYDSDLAGLHSGIGIEGNSLTLSFSGYNEKLRDFALTVIDRVLNFELDENLFAFMKNIQLQSLDSFSKISPMAQVNFIRKFVQSKNSVLPLELLSATESLQPDDVMNEFRRLLSQGSIECFCHGNMRGEDALDFFNHMQRLMKDTRPIESLSGFRTYPIIQTHSYRNLVVIPPATENPNNVYSLLFQTGVAGDYDSTALTLVLHSMFQEVFFNILRTQKQLGYAVAMELNDFNRTPAISFIVQSEFSPAVLEEHVLGFVDEMISIMNQMPDEYIHKIANNLIQGRSKGFKRLCDEAASHWSKIETMAYNFNHNRKIINALEAVTREKIVEFIQDKLLVGGSGRKALIVQIWSQDLAKERDSYFNTLSANPSIFVVESPKDLVSQILYEDDLASLYQ